MIIRNIRVILAWLIAVVGCARQSDDELTFSTPVQFEQTTEPQIVVFYTDRFSTGGVGEPVLDEKRRTIFLNGLRVAISDETLQIIVDTLKKKVALPSCVRGEKILVKARIHLEKHTAPDGSIEGAPEETVYLLIVDELLDVLWSAEPCD